MTTTSRAIRELLERKGVVPTGDSKKDLELAKSVMPKPYSKDKSSDATSDRTNGNGTITS